MERLSAMIGNLGDARIGGADSFVDRLNCRYTVYIFVVSAFFVTARHYVGDPIGCWCPAHFSDSHVDYTNKLCWVTNNYYLPFTDRIPRAGEHRGRLIAYYQWVGVFLMGQAVIFYLPRPMWRLLNNKSGTGECCCNYLSPNGGTEVAMGCLCYLRCENCSHILIYIYIAKTL